MKACRISTCTRRASTRPAAYGFCTPCALGWYFSREAARENTEASRQRYQQRREFAAILSGPKLAGGVR